MDDKHPVRLRQYGTDHAPISARSALNTPAGTSDQPAGSASLYIHIPFCFHKCHYCDFYSFVDTRGQQDAFTDRLVRELAALAPHAGPLRSVFVGGGTPTLLRTDLWQRLLERFHASFVLAPGAEFTVECNPETASPELFGVLAGGGVNRLSLGAQSFDPAHLKTLERWHEPASVARAIDQARAAGIARLSVDLIFAIPGQSTREALSDVERAISLGTEHLSCYALTYEPKTAMTARLARGDFEPCPEETETEMFVETGRLLASEGFERYEVSNFARPGAECRHNLAYWRQEDWLASGPSASGHAKGWRWKNVPRLGDYLAFDDDGYAPITDVEQPDDRRALVERVMTGLRLAEGLDRHEIEDALERIDPGASDRIARVVEEHRGRGWLLASERRLVLSPEGLLMADRACVDLMSAIDP